MRKQMRVIIPILMLLMTLGAFGAGAWVMSRSVNRPLPDMSLSDPRTPGASQRAEKQAAEPAITQEEDILSQTQEMSAGQRVPVPLFWMALGAVSTAVGILVATRERRTYGSTYR